jgi:hypothetical protein
VKCLVLAIAALLIPAIGQPQRMREGSPSGLPPDSVPWRPVIEYVIASLAGDILRASRDSTPRAWRIVLPDTGPAWTRLHAHLSSSLRARPPRPEETDVDELVIGPMRASGDTATVHITRDHVRSCPGGARVVGYRNAGNVIVVRFQGRFWSAARSLGVLHMDREGCQ